MIGHVQSRKAKIVCEHFSLVHSLDNKKLAERLNYYAGEAGKVLPVLLEFNLSGEESKSGWSANDENQWDKFLPEIDQINSFTQLRVQGLMAMPPLFDDPEYARPYFKKLRKLQGYLKSIFPDIDWKELSMGTSSDYRVAIQEGATLIRIGQAILGPRI
jgi:pyridoxal phosphate enzyme (YggS family)